MTHFRFYKSIALGQIVTGLLLAACGDRSANFSALPEHAVLLNGTVYAWYCGVQDWNNNPRHLPGALFSVETGEAAKVTIVDDQGKSFIQRTDDSSRVDFLLSEGHYTAIVETGYSFPPDTFNLKLNQGDTSLPFDIVYRVTDPLYMVFDFTYPTIEGHPPVETEWAIIEELNDRTVSVGKPYRALDIVGRDSEDFHSIGSTMLSSYSRYTLPVLRESPGAGTVYNIQEADDLIAGLIEDDTTGLYPENLYVYPLGVYICPQ